MNSLQLRELLANNATPLYVFDLAELHLSLLHIFPLTLASANLLLASLYILATVALDIFMRLAHPIWSKCSKSMRRITSYSSIPNTTFSKFFSDRFSGIKDATLGIEQMLRHLGILAISFPSLLHDGCSLRPLIQDKRCNILHLHCIQIMSICQ